MSVLQIIGACMLATPILAMLTLIVLFAGWIPVAIALSVVGLVFLGAVLIVEGGE